MIPVLTHNVTDVTAKLVLLEERTRSASLDLLSVESFLFGSGGQEVDADVIGGVHPDGLLLSHFLSTRAPFALPRILR